MTSDREGVGQRVSQRGADLPSLRRHFPGGCIVDVDVEGSH